MIIQATSIRHEPIHKDFGHNYQSDFWGTFDEVVTKFRLSMATFEPPVSWAYLIDCKSSSIIATYKDGITIVNNKDNSLPLNHGRLASIWNEYET